MSMTDELTCDAAVALFEGAAHRDPEGLKDVLLLLRETLRPLRADERRRWRESAFFKPRPEPGRSAAAGAG